MINKLKNYSLLLIFSLIFYLICFLAINQKSLTSDEGVHLVSGFEYLKFRDFRWNPEHPPLIKEIAAIPLLFMNLKVPHDCVEYEKVEQWGYSYNFFYVHNKDKFPNAFKYSRAIMILFGILLGLYIFITAKDLYKLKIALIPIFLFFFDPNFLGHSPLITTDVPSTAFGFGTFYFLFKFHKKHKYKYLIYSSLLFGLALSSKHSIFIILPIIVTVIFIMLLLNKGLIHEIYKISKEKKIIFFILFISMIIIFNAKTIFGFTNYILRIGVIFLLLMLFLENKIFLKDDIKKILNFFYAFVFILIFIIGGGILITPIFYLDYKNSIFAGDIFKSFNNLVYIINHAKHGHGWIFLNGKFYEKGSYLYYLYIFMIKTPLPSLILIFCGFLSTLIMKKEEQILFFILPPIIYMFLISIINRAQIGIRHELFIYPFLFIIVGNFFEFLNLKYNKIINLLIIFFSLWIIYEGLKGFPNYISYTNGVFFKPENAYLYISDSNIDWGQDIPTLIKYLGNVKKSNKIYVKMHYEKTLKAYGYCDYININEKDINEKLRGILVIDVEEYNKFPDRFMWLRKNKKPDVIINNSILIFNL